MKEYFNNFMVTATTKDKGKIVIYNYEYNYENGSRFNYEDIEVGIYYYYQTFASDGYVYVEGVKEKLPIIDLEDCESIFKGELTEKMKKILELNEIEKESIVKINTFAEFEIPNVVHRYKRHVYK